MVDDVNSVEGAPNELRITHVSDSKLNVLIEILRSRPMSAMNLRGKIVHGANLVSMM
jgi:hypothetical protein